jgi:hypothetical protein
MKGFYSSTQTFKDQYGIRSMKDFEMSVTDFKAEEFVRKLAIANNISNLRSSDDELADIVTRLSGDDVETDEIEDMLVNLKRSKVISGKEMVFLLGKYLDEKSND